MATFRIPRSAGLVALCTVPVLAGALVLRVVGFDSATGLSPQLTAPAAYGVFHDLRWLMVYHESWPGLAGEVVAAVLLRSLLVAGIVQLAWPEDRRRPAWRVTWGRSTSYVAVTLLLLSPWAVVAMAASETALSWFLFGELLPLAVLAAALSRGGIERGWWRGLPSLATIGWSIAAFGWLTVAAMVVSFTPAGWDVPVAAATAVPNAFLWRRLVATVLRGPARLRWFPSVPVVFALSLVFLALLGRLFGLGQQLADRPPPQIQAGADHRIADEILYVPGYDSSYQPAKGAQRPGVVFYSYAGADHDGLPDPYDAAQTHQSLDTSADLLARQVRALAARTGRPIALLAQSEGTLVVRAYLAEHAHRAVAAAILLSPLVQPGRVYFPPSDASAGWGLASGWELRGMLAVARWSTGAHISADEPFVRSILAHASFYRNQMLCPVAGVRVLAFLPTVSAAVVPPGAVSHVPTIEVPGLHASLLGRPFVQERISRFLRGWTPGIESEWYYAVIQKAAGAWQAPALALGLNPVWQPSTVPDVAVGPDGCRGQAARLSATSATATISRR